MVLVSVPTFLFLTNPIVKESLVPFEFIQRPSETETVEPESEEEKTPFFEKIFKNKRKKKMKKVKNSLFSSSLNNLEIESKRNHSDNESRETPIKDVIKKKFNEIKKFTKEIFKDKEENKAEEVSFAQKHLIYTIIGRVSNRN